MGRRRTQPGIQIIYWRDIPAQLTATGEDGSHKALLSERFQVAIDRAATVAGLTDTQDYVGQWRREDRPVGDDPEQELAALAAAFESDYDRARLEALVATGGAETEPTDPTNSPEEPS